MQVRVFGPLRSATGDKTVEVTVDPDVVQDVVDAFLDEYPKMRSQIYSSEGSIRPSVRVLVDGEKVSLEDPCTAESVVSLFPAMQGG